ADTAIAEPAAVHLHVTAFWDAEFRARFLDKLAIVIGGFRNVFPRQGVPPMAFEEAWLGPHLGDAEFLRGNFGKVEKLGKFQIALAVGNTLVSHFLEPLPTHHRSKAIRRSVDDRPFGKENRWDGFQPWAARLGNGAIRRANALAEGEAAIGFGD